MIPFQKYHGLGNDFIIYNEKDVLGKDYSDLAIKSCNRNTGIGADGMIICVKKGPTRAEMVFYNADGSRAKMCGNGVRAFSQYLFDNAILKGTSYEIETLAGVMLIELDLSNGFQATVNMGTPDFTPSSIPISREDEVINEKMNIIDKDFNITALLMGATHSVIFVDDLSSFDMIKYGSFIENMELFPDRTNVNFVEIKNSTNIKMQTFERGAGLTLACGTGACSAVVVGNKLNKLDKEVCVQLPLGELIIKLTDKGVFMTGPSEKIAEGKFCYR